MLVSLHLHKSITFLFMKAVKILVVLVFSTLTLSCISTKNTIKNIDISQPIPKLTTKNTFVLTEISTDVKYGFDPDYPINIFFRNANEDDMNLKRYLNALSGPHGETINYKKIGICCPFPTKNTNTGGGFLEVIEISYEGLQVPLKLYLNRYEKGVLKAPLGLGIKPIL